MRRLALALAVAALALPRPAAAYFDDVVAGARGAALGPAALALVTDVSAYHWNPAALSALAGPEVLFDYAKPYGVPDLNVGTAAVGFRRFGAGWAAAWHRLGIADAYGEDQLSLSAGRRVVTLRGHALAAGATFRYGRISFPAFTDPDFGTAVDMGSQGKGDLDLALEWISPWHVDVAWVARNLLEPRYEMVAGSGGELQTLRHQVAAAFRWNRESSIVVGWGQPKRGESSFNAGIEILFFDVFAIRSGLENLSNVYQSHDSPTELQYSGGFGVFHRGYHVDAAATTNHDLGASYRVTVRVPIGKAEGR